MNGKTFKVTFFDNEMDVFTITTYHNVENQSSLIEWIARKIDVLGLHPAVKCEANGRSYTQVVNDLLNYRLEFK